jgi:hypothetical protein
MVGSLGVSMYLGLLTKDAGTCTICGAEEPPPVFALCHRFCL